MADTTVSAPSPPPSTPSLISINDTAQIPLKLTSTNYTAWHLQFRALLLGYDLMGFVDDSNPCPPKTITQATATIPNPAYSLWVRQDQLLLNAITGSLTPTLIPFIVASQTSLDAWTILSKTYASPSRGRILQLKNQLSNPVKGSKSITDFMHGIKAIIDALALMNVSYDSEDLTLKVLNGLDDTYNEISHAIQARDTPISFDELHEKLLSFEAQLLHRPPAVTGPTTAFPASRSARPSTVGAPHDQHRPSGQPCPRGPTLWAPRPMSGPSGQSPRPYLGRCQLCGTTGHSAKRCPNFQYLSWTPPSPSQQPPPAYAHPQAHSASHSLSQPSSTEWILDSGASHHVTTDLANLSLHAPYDGSDTMTVGNGTGDGSSHGGSAPHRAL